MLGIFGEEVEVGEGHNVLCFGKGMWGIAAWGKARKTSLEL